LAEKWFGSIEDHKYEIRPIPQEPEQKEARREVVERDVPATNITIAFHMGDRLSKEFFLGDITSDLRAGGDSARLYDRLIKQRSLFATVNAYISGDVDEGMFIFTCQLLPTTSEDEAEQAIWKEIEDLQRGNISDYELEKVKNKFEANTLFGELNVMNKAMNLGYYSMIGDLSLINREVDIYRSLSKDDIARFSQNIFRKENSSTLIYRAKKR
jgi:predicted Zn-dependent peptidase